MHEGLQLLGLPYAVLCANQRQYSYKCFLPDIFNRFLGIQTRAQFERDEFAEVGREMVFGAQTTDLQPFEVRRVERGELQVGFLPGYGRNLAFYRRFHGNRTAIAEVALKPVRHASHHAYSSAPRCSSVSLTSPGQPSRTRSVAAAGRASLVHNSTSRTEARRHKGCNPGATSRAVTSPEGGGSFRCRSVLRSRSGSPWKVTIPPSWARRTMRCGSNSARSWAWKELALLFARRVSCSRRHTANSGDGSGSGPAMQSRKASASAAKNDE